jgi:hypothetical protein
MVFSLAKDTGWSESFILWELPLVRALEYQHAILWGNGAWTVRAEERLEDQIALLQKLAANDVDDDLLDV